MIVREFSIADRHAVHEVIHACDVFTAEEMQAARWMVEDWRPFEVDDDYAFFVVEIDAQVQGYACISKTPLTASTWHLYWICVHPRAQGLGAGQALMSHSEAFIRLHGGKRIVLETSGQPQYERTRCFYHSGGYREVGRIRDFYKPSDDCVIFCKELS